ncbi:hypothetical protein CC85DRAFT_287521 [Cutaneotrichosporon oleaginosum]|uniref:Uncharacterized protein n=1 Tax=Cutaneotrichosporon oleaginosum TaxID=879819 RepID=A0A0J0XHD7_9TREE|nr:uncharacterized protein CC85DRAFT_287521 [Cutaneotrichosporon oleaginosum]KLT40417.1 hypothetical protein CC85DRAFT_287521 [Cutaneotrichosporon oleaginosum]TXT11382.1 hypothetical protein COLE_01792 [Cutaneotrichosporon oleaginosum]
MAPFNTTLVSSPAPASSSAVALPSSPTALTDHFSNFAGCTYFPQPWKAKSVPQAFWPPKVPRGPGNARACIVYPNYFMDECCGYLRRESLCGWTACIGGMTDKQYSACFERLAIRDGLVDSGDYYHSYDPSDGDNEDTEDEEYQEDGEYDDGSYKVDANGWNVEYRKNVTRRGPPYEWTCARASAKYGAKRAVLSVVGLAVAVSVLVTGL